MALTIKDTYDIQEHPKTWPDALNDAVKHFFAANGLLPNCLVLHEVLAKLFPRALEIQGFKVLSVGLKEGVKEEIAQMEKFEDVLDMPFTMLVSPEGDYDLLVTVSDKVDLLQFQLVHIDGRVKKVN